MSVREQQSLDNSLKFDAKVSNWWYVFNISILIPKLQSWKQLYPSIKLCFTDFGGKSHMTIFTCTCGNDHLTFTTWLKQKGQTAVRIEGQVQYDQKENKSVKVKNIKHEGEKSNYLKDLRQSTRISIMALFIRSHMVTKWDKTYLKRVKKHTAHKNCGSPYQFFYLSVLLFSFLFSSTSIFKLNFTFWILSSVTN